MTTSLKFERNGCKWQKIGTIGLVMDGVRCIYERILYIGGNSIQNMTNWHVYAIDRSMNICQEWIVLYLGRPQAVISPNGRNNKIACKMPRMFQFNWRKCEVWVRALCPWRGCIWVCSCGKGRRSPGEASEGGSYLRLPQLRGKMQIQCLNAWF